MFITFEGIDGSGKTTQAKLLYEFLKNNKIDCTLSKEPLPFVKDILKNFDVSKESELLLMEVSRQIHQEYIKNSLNTDKVVIIDRYVDSTVAYQYYGKKISLAKLAWLEKFIFDNKVIMPHLTFLLDIDPSIAKQRKINSGIELTKTDKQDLSFFKRVREGYINLAERYDRIKLINSARSVKDTQAEIQDIVKEEIKQYIKNIDI